MCRKVGPFIPIAFAFEPSICNKKPTHVFNPCGHVASREICDYWSNLSVYNRNISLNEKSACCPYCAVELIPINIGNNKCYSRLILQTESGQWSDNDEQFDNNNSNNNHYNHSNNIVLDSKKNLEILQESQQELFNRENLASMTDTINIYKSSFLYPRYSTVDNI